MRGLGCEVCWSGDESGPGLGGPGTRLLPPVLLWSLILELLLPPLICNATPLEVVAAMGAIPLVGSAMNALPPMYSSLVLSEYSGGKV